MKLLRRRDLVCQEAVALVIGYIEGTLSRASRDRFESHLAACPDCTEYFEHVRATIRLTGRLGTEDLTPEMQHDLIVLYRRWRDNSE
jgi:anti-sigma factor RsiW